MMRKIRVGERYTLSSHKHKPKRLYRYISLLAVLTSMCLYAVKQASAQQAEPATTAVANIEPLQIGDTIPEYLWHLPLQVVNYPPTGGKDTITLNEYRGKLIILDFWATWCGSCIAAFPKLDSLTSTFDEQVELIRTTYQSATEVKHFLHQSAKRNTMYSGLYSVVEDDKLRNIFPHRLVPHYVWINPVGVVETFSTTDAITGSNLEKVLEGNQLGTVVKSDLKKGVPLFMIDGFQGERLMYHAVLRKGTYPGLAGGNQYYRVGDTLRGRAMTNATLKTIYSIVARELFKNLNEPYYANRVVWRVEEPLVLEEIYNFELLVPVKDAALLYTYMLSELNRYTPFKSEIVTEQIPCYVLTADRLQGPEATSGAVNTRKLMGFLNRTPLVDLPVVNEMSADIPIDIEFDAMNRDELLTQLAQHGLRLTETTRSIPFFVIEDK